MNPFKARLYLTFCDKHIFKSWKMDFLYYNLFHVAEAKTLSVKHNKSSEIIYCREQNFLFEKDLLTTPKT